MLHDLYSHLRKNPYPGRGILLGRSQDGNQAVMAYFIMGRSENSRNRVFVEKDGGILAQAFDPAKVSDPSLILYAPVRVTGDGVTLVTNGDQTDTLLEHLQNGESFETALRTRTFEPDAPNFTPRISGMMQVQGGAMAYRLSILKSSDGNENSVQRFFFEYAQPVRGEGHLLHTYRADGNPLPSFEGEPVRVQVAGDVDGLCNGLWESLDPDNKISLFVRTVDLHTGHEETRIFNKNL